MKSNEEHKQITPEAIFQEGEKYFFLNNWSRAMPLFREAAELKYPRAFLRLGIMYQKELGVSQNEIGVADWYGQARNQHQWFCHDIVEEENYSSSSLYYLGLYFQFCKKNHKVAFENYESSQKDIRGLISLADCYFEGIGVKENKTIAAGYYEIAAKQGNPCAQFRLSQCYANGWGIRQDQKEAIKWCHQAAQQYHIDAQFYLAECYKKDEVVQNQQESAYWHDKAFYNMVPPGGLVLMHPGVQDSIRIDNNLTKKAQAYQQNYINLLFSEVILGPLFQETFIGKNSTLFKLISSYVSLEERDWQPLLSKTEEYKKACLDPIWFSYIFFPLVFFPKNRVILTHINEYLFGSSSADYFSRNNFSYRKNLESINLAKYVYNRWLRFKVDDFIISDLNAYYILRSDEIKILHGAGMKKFRNTLATLKKKGLKPNLEQCSLPGRIHSIAATGDFERLVHAFIDDKLSDHFGRDPAGNLQALLPEGHKINVPRMLTAKPDMAKTAAKLSNKDLEKCYIYFMNLLFQTDRSEFESFYQDGYCFGNGTINQNLHPADLLAIFMYTLLDFSPTINMFFRTGGVKLKEKNVSHKAIFLLTVVIMHAHANLPFSKDATEAIRLQFYKDTTSGIKFRKNSIVFEPAFFSSHHVLMASRLSLSEEQRAEKIIYMVNNKTGKFIDHLSKYRHKEQEILFCPGQRFELLAEHIDEENRPYLLCEPIDSEPGLTN